MVFVHEAGAEVARHDERLLVCQRDGFPGTDGVHRGIGILG